MNIPLNIDWQQILLHFFNFSILVGGLYLLLFKPVKSFMAKREKHYADMESAAVAREKDTEELKAEGIISGGMIPKVECCTNAIRAGVRKVFIIDGRVPHALLIETLTDEGAGTMFKKEIEGNYVPKS